MREPTARTRIQPASLLTRVWPVPPPISPAQRLRLLPPDFALVLAAVDVLRTTTTMSIAPITGKLRKRFWLDLTTALGLGTTAGYAFWSVSCPFLFARHASSPPRNRYGVHLKRGEHPPLVAHPSRLSTAHLCKFYVIIRASADLRRLLPYSSAPGGVLPEARAVQAAGVNVGALCNTFKIHCLFPHPPSRECNANAVASPRVYIRSRPLAWTGPGAFSEVHPADPRFAMPQTRDARNTCISVRSSSSILHLGSSGVVRG